MNIVVSGMMGSGTLEAKIEPLSRVSTIEKIIFVRKKSGPKIDKVEYHVLPKICSISFFNLLITPLVLLWVCFKHKADLIVGYHIVPYAFFVSFSGIVTRTPYIIGQTGGRVQELVKGNVIFKFIIGLIFKYSFKINCPGSHSVNFWKDQFKSYTSKFNILHSTVDTNIFIPNKHQSKIYDFIFLGMLYERKNIDLIIKSVNTLNKKYEQEYTLQIVGSGPEENKLVDLTNSLDATQFIHFKGFAFNQIPYLNKSKFLVMASSREGLPTALMQAMSCEVIPITNIVDNINELLTDDLTGFVIDKIDQDSVFESLNRAINCEESKLNKIRKNCRKLIIQKHSHDSAINRWDKLLKEI